MESDEGTAMNVDMLNLDDQDADSWYSQQCIQPSPPPPPSPSPSQPLSALEIATTTIITTSKFTDDPIDSELPTAPSPIPELEIYYCLRNNEFILGLFLPIVTLVTLVTNCLVSAVLLQRHMRTPVNVLLLAISMFNMATGTFPIPVLIHFYTMRNYRDYVSQSWCFWYPMLLDFIPTVCHTTSIWLTVFVALQRYVYVCKPQSASSWCTIRVSTIGILVMFISSIFYYLPALFERSCGGIETASLRYPNTTVIAMARVNRDWFDDSFKIYLQIKFWSRFLLVNFIPSGSLIVFTALLLKEIRKTNERRRTMISREAQSSRSSESNSTTLMLLAIVFLFLLVEIPPGIAFLLFLPTISIAYPEEPTTVIISTEDYVAISLILNIGVLLSYPINFFIYCAMSRQFRETFYALFFCGRGDVKPTGECDRSRAKESTSKVPRPRTVETAILVAADCSNGHPALLPAR